MYMLYTLYFHSFFSCPRLDKVGGLGDGPKWTCDIDRVGTQAARRKQADPDPTSPPDKKHCLMYSVGSNGDYQWEDAVQETLKSTGGCEIHIFDPVILIAAPMRRRATIWLPSKVITWLLRTYRSCML
jgi:hypothetical protein